MPFIYTLYNNRGRILIIALWWHCANWINHLLLYTELLVNVNIAILISLVAHLTAAYLRAIMVPAHATL